MPNTSPSSTPFRLVVISGSTRDASTNSAFARLAARSSPEGTHVTAFTALSGLPHFDPDLDRDPLPAAVVDFRTMIERADAVVFCVPEYAGALPGSFKNALDWSVGCTAFTDKAVAWVTISADPNRGSGARAELATVLGYVQANVIPSACIHVPIAHAAIDPTGEILDLGTRESVTSAVATLSAQLRSGSASPSAIVTARAPRALP